MSSTQHVLVTGAGGYVGRHVVAALADLGHEVTAVVRPGSRAEIDARARVVHADILAPDHDVRSLSDSPPTSVVHLAWQDGFTHNAHSHILLLSAHFGFLEQLVSWGVEHLSVLGTMHEIGYWEGPITAETPTSPTTLYGIAKDALRRAVFVAFADRVALSWLRCFYIYGDDRRNHSIFTRILEAADAGKPTFPFTSGRNRYDFIQVDELARQIAIVSTQREVLGVVNCASGVPTSLADKVEEFIEANELPISLEYGAYPDRPYDSPGVWADVSELRVALSNAE